MSEPAEDPDVPSEPERRRFLVLATGATGACAAALASLPALVAFVAPAGRRTVLSNGGQVEIGRARDFRTGTPRRVVVRADQTDAWMSSEVELGAAWVVRRGDGMLSAFSATCPHLGCAIDAGPGPDVPFVCPCHDSGFALDGTCLSGPSPRPLDGLAVHEQDGRVYLEFKRFVGGVSEKVEV